MRPRPGKDIIMVENAFEARLGVPMAVKGDNSVTHGDAISAVEESVVNAGLPRSVVLVVMDVNNKELSMVALDWTLKYVVQKGDSVKLLGILQHIMNPMGYKSWADEVRWNGANRIILNAEIKSHKERLEQIRGMCSRFSRLGATLEIDVKASLDSKHLVVEEAKRLAARYVVIDRHIKKDNQFYIEHMPCFVTRVKSITMFEHLRHGVPGKVDRAETIYTVDVTLAKHSDIKNMPKAYTSSTLSCTPTANAHSDPIQQPLSPTSILISNMRPETDYFDDGILYDGGGRFQDAGWLHRSTMHSSYVNRQEMDCIDMDHTATTRDLSSRHYLTAPRAMVHSPAFDTPFSELGYMAKEFPRQSISPATEAVLTGHMSKFYNVSSYTSQPFMTESVEYPFSWPPSDNVHPHITFPQSAENSTSRFSHTHSVPFITSELAAGCPESPTGSVETHDGIVELRKIMSDAGLGSRAPVSWVTRGADGNWASENFTDSSQPTLSTFQLDRPHTPPLTEVYPRLTPPPLRSVESAPELEATIPSPQGRHQDPSPPADGTLTTDRISSVQCAVSSKKKGVGTPPLCSVCQHKSPDFGKVKRFAYTELQEATDYFSKENYLAEGGYGSVYKGQMKDGQVVAIKQHKFGVSSQGDEEFCAEVEVLSCAQHRNLVTLVGYCVENQRRLLVYEYVCNGSLDRHLAAKNKTGLQWQHRHKIALGTARALRYLHEECRVGCIVHRDMRPNNILLTHDFTPMVGDFGLAMRQLSADEVEVTRVIGTIGYLAPEYAATGQITEKADVYAFGVVLLELISGRKAIEKSESRGNVSLIEWARPLLDSFDKELIDPRLKMQYEEFQLHSMMHAASQCIEKDPANRPQMTKVLRILNPPQERDWAYGSGSGQDPKEAEGQFNPKFHQSTSSPASQGVYPDAS